MKKCGIIILVLSVIIIGLLFIMFIGKNKFDKEVKSAKAKTELFEEKIKGYEDKVVLTEEEFGKLSEKEKIVVYQEVVKEKEKIINTSKEILEENKKLVKNLDKCNTKLKRKDKLLLNFIVGAGVDQEFNLIGMAGGTVNGKVFDGLFSKIYLGGGGVYTVRSNFRETINGGNLIFNVIITLGK